MWSLKNTFIYEVVLFGINILDTVVRQVTKSRHVVPSLGALNVEFPQVRGSNNFLSSAMISQDLNHNRKPYYTKYLKKGF